MTYDMKLNDQQGRVASIELAGALLRAWEKGDRPALEVELDRSSSAPGDMPDTGEAERLQMLRAIAVRMKASADPLAVSYLDLGLGVCVDLLSHLARPASRPQAKHVRWPAFEPSRQIETHDSAASSPVHPEPSTIQ